MTSWRQAVFVRQRRIDVIQRALSTILDEESWSPATPRRLRVGSADASSRGWTMVVPELANFFLDRGGTPERRLCRLARELRCPAYEVDVRGAAAITLLEVDPLGRTRISGAPLPAAPAAPRDDDAIAALASPSVGFGLIAIAGDADDRIAALDRARPLAIADYLGALAGFPAWTRHGDDAIAAGELIYEPHVIAGSHGRAHAYDQITARRPEPRAASARTTPRAALSASANANDRRSARPRSASRPRR